MKDSVRLLISSLKTEGTVVSMAKSSEQESLYALVVGFIISHGEHVNVLSRAFSQESF